MSAQKVNPGIGSSLDDFLKEEGIYEECYAQATKEIEEWKRESARSKGIMIKRMVTKRLTSARPTRRMRDWFLRAG